MKKLLTLAVVAVLAVCTFTACGNKGESNSTPTDKAYNVNEILAAIEEVAPVSNEAEVSKDYLSWLGIKEEYYTDYAGKYCSVTPGVDIILVVEAEKGCEDDIVSAMEARKNALVSDNENYDEFLASKANEGRIVVKSNYVVMVISGNGETVEDMASNYENIDNAINSAF